MEAKLLESKFYEIGKYEKIALIILGLPILGILINSVTEGFRYSDIRLIYQIGWILNYALWLTSFILGYLNSVNISTKTKWKWQKKLFWTLVSLLSILYLGLMFIIYLIKSL